MNASSQSFSDSAADAEITAELPVLDVSAYEARQGQDPLSSTDTWASPTVNTAILPQLGQPAAESAPELNQAALKASRLEVELKSLAISLAELETRLAAKGERLKIIEAELAEARQAGQAAAERAVALSEELIDSRAAVAAATAQTAAVQETLRHHDETVRSASERESTLRQALAKREAEFASSTAADAARTAGLIATHDSALRASRQQVAQLQAQGAAHLETLHSMEGRRGIFESILRGLDGQIGTRDQQHARVAGDLARSTAQGAALSRELEERTQRIAQLEAEVAAVNSRLGARTDEAGAMARTNEELNQSLHALRQESTGRATRIAELEAQAGTDRQAHTEALRAAAAGHSELQEAHNSLIAHKTALETELAGLREQSAEHVAAVQQIAAEHANRLAQIEAREMQIAALTAQVATQAQTIHTEVERNRLAQERIDIAENDLRGSEESINRLEAEVRARNMRVEELTRINTQMQADIADARLWLDGRDSLLERLETEAAHSSALVDNIQRSIRSLAPGNSGTHEVLRESGARLLVSSQDGHEVVHVLGRKTTIGRTPDNDLRIDASFVSRHHAVLLVNGQQTVIEDLNSTNGVHVNGQRVSRETLNDGDQVMIGKARFRFAIRPAVSRGSEPSA